MNKHTGGHMDGTAIEGGLGPAAQQALAEGPDDEGSQAAPDAAAVVAADAGDGAIKPGDVSEEPRAESPEHAERVCRVDGCGVRHDRNYLVCGMHWRLLPAELQGRINAAYLRVKATGLVNREYAKLSAIAVNWLNAGGAR